MHLDLETPGLPPSFTSDVCIVGGGTSGILLASRLANAGITVNLLEGGSLELAERSQKLYEIDLAGCSHSGILNGRFRTFGGASTRWGGGLLPYTDDVVNPPEQLNLPRWPISLAEVEPYYEELQEVMGVEKTPFTDDLLKGFKRERPFRSAKVRLRYCKSSPFNRRNLARTLGRECLASRNVSVFTNCNVVSIDLEKNAQKVQGVTAVNYGGVVHKFVARQFILCTGTIEASRLLLASRKVCPNGVGNDRDQVGRYFHDHVFVRAAAVEGPDRARMIDAFAPYIQGRTLYKARLEATEELRKERNWLSVGAEFPVEEPAGSGEERVLTLFRALQRGDIEQIVQQDLRKLPPASVEIAKMLMHAKLKHRRYISKRATIIVHIDVEQRPRAESCVRLSNDVDAVGMPKAVLDWKISPEEHETIRGFGRELKGLFHRQGLADIRLKFEDSEERGPSQDRNDSFHMMGGARMGTDPASSVVDCGLRVHGVNNLRVLSCAVFPTGGSSNPTFTMLTLALRLADQFRTQHLVEAVC